MEAPTRKEISEKLDWQVIDSEVVGRKHNLRASYAWKDLELILSIQPWTNEQYFDWRIGRDTSNLTGNQCKSIEDAVNACVDAILDLIDARILEYQEKKEEERKLGEHNAKAQEWANRANSVIIEG